MRISDWSSDVCSSDLVVGIVRGAAGVDRRQQVGALHLELRAGLQHVGRRHPQVTVVGEPRLDHLLQAGIEEKVAPADPRDVHRVGGGGRVNPALRSEEHTSELQSLMRNSYAVFCFKQKQSVSTAEI